MVSKAQYSGLGKLLSVYKGTGIGIRTWIFFILPTSAVITFTLLFGTLIAWQNYLKHGPTSALYLATPWYIAAIILLVLLLPYFIFRLFYSFRRIDVFEEGIEYRNILLNRRQYNWFDINGITSSARTITFKNKHIRTEPIGIIYPKTGRPIILTRRFQHIPQLIAEIKSLFYPHIWPNIESNYYSDKVINFGLVSISKKQLCISNNPLSWESIYRIKVEAGDLLIELQNNNHYQVPVSEVQNLELFFQIVNLGVGS